MAYHNGRKTYGRRRSRHVFGKRKERAIRAIAMGPVETKKFTLSNQGFTTPSTASPTVATVYNAYFNLPKGSVGDSEQTVTGNKFMARGLKIYIQSNNKSDMEYRFRVTVFSSTADSLSTSGVATVVLNSSPIYEQDVGLPIALRRFDTQVVRVLKSKTWTVKKNYATQVAEESFHTMWVPISGMKTSRLEEAGGALTNVGYLKGVQYFILVEAYQSGSVGPVYDWSGMTFDMAWTVYFKDP